MVAVQNIESKDFDLSINRYKEIAHEQVKHEPPKRLIAKLRTLEAEILEDIAKLETML
jgi:type I restriction enzyme M protein